MPKEILISNENGMVFQITKKELRELRYSTSGVDASSPYSLELKDLGTALKVLKTREVVDVRYAVEFSSGHVHELGRVRVLSSTLLHIGCQTFLGDNAKAIIAAAKKAVAPKTKATTAKKVTKISRKAA